MSGEAVVAMPLFHRDSGGSTPTSPLQKYFIIKITHKEAKYFIEKWHYSKKMPTGKNINFGLYDPKWNLYAVIVFGIGVNPYQANFLGVKKVTEIKRMCRVEPKERYPLSKFISISLKLLKKEMSFDAVIAFADPTHGHEGIVYKASGFVHEGMTNPEYHLRDEYGNIRHRRYAFRHARRNNISIDESRKILGVERIKTLPKHRWVKRFITTAPPGSC